MVVREILVLLKMAYYEHAMKKLECFLVVQAACCESCRQSKIYRICKYGQCKL